MSLLRAITSAITSWFYNLPEGPTFAEFVDSSDLPTDQAYDQYYSVLANRQW